MIEMVGVYTDDRRVLHLRGCSLRAEASQIHALVGPSSSGKTLVLDVLVGLVRPVRGMAQVLGIDSALDNASVRERVTYIPRGGVADTGMTLSAHVTWVSRLAGAHPTPTDVRRALRDAEVPDRYFDRPPSEAPLESRVLAWLAVASLRRHRVVLLDEPMHVLSAGATNHVSHVLRQWRSTGACILLTSQDRQFVDTVADVVTAIEDGRTAGPIVFERPPRPLPLTSDPLPGE